MPKRSHEYMQKRRSQILDAATQCGLRKGWNHLTVDEVAAAANLSKGAVYVHFQSKKAILHGLLERSAEAIEAIGTYRTADEFRRSLHAAVSAYNATQGRNLAIKQLEMLLESARDATLQSTFRRVTERLIDNVQTVIQRLRPDLSPNEVADAALILVLLLHGVRSLRAQSDIPGGADVRRVIGREINEILEPSRRTLRVEHGRETSKAPPRRRHASRPR